MPSSGARRITVFIASPDLPQRLVHRIPLNEADRATFYGGADRGYTDYPRLAEHGCVAVAAAQ